MERLKKTSIFIPFLFFIFNLCLRYIGIEVNSLAGDEPFSVYFGQMEIADILRHLKPGNNPPLFELILHYWEQLFGIGEVAVRIPSLIFSAVTAAFIYKIGAEYFFRSIGLVSAILFTFSNYATYFSHEARVYALFGMLTCLSFYYFLRWLNDRYSFKTLVVYVIVSVLLLYAHYFGLMVVGLQVGLAILFAFRDSKKIGHFALCFVAVIILFIPYIPVVFTQFTKTKSDGTWLVSPQGWASIKYVLMQFANSGTLVKIVLVLFGLAVIRNVKNIRSVSQNTWVVIAWFCVPFLGMFLLSYKVPMFHDRYLMHTFIGFIVLLGVSSMSVLKYPIVKWIIPLGLVFSFAFKSHRNIDNGRHTKEAIQKVQDLRDDDTRIVLYPKYRIFAYAYYFNRDRFINFDREFVYYDVLEGFKEENFYGINQYSEARIDSTCRKVIFMMTDGGPRDQLVSEFENDFQQVGHYFYPEIIDVYEFER